MQDHCFATKNGYVLLNVMPLQWTLFHMMQTAVIDETKK